MKKQLIKCMLIAMTFGMIATMNAMAENNESGTETPVKSSIIVDRSDNVSILSDNAEQTGITAVRMSLYVTPEDEDQSIEDVTFEFSKANNIKITDYRYHEDTGLLNIYAADSQSLFHSNALSLGAVKATGENGKEIKVLIETPENALSMGTQGGELDVVSNYSNEKKEIGEHYMDITMTCPVDYTLVIPNSNSDLNENDKLKVEVKNALLNYGQSLKISVTSENNWQLKDKEHPENPEMVAYTLEGSGGNVLERKTEDILTISNGRPSDFVDLIVSKIGESRTAGTFDDTLTFTVELSK